MITKSYKFAIEYDDELKEILQNALSKKLNKSIKIEALTFSTRYQELTVHYEVMLL